MKSNQKVIQNKIVGFSGFKKVLIIVALIGIIIYLFITAQRGSDFACYLGAALKLNSYQNIYGPPFVLNRPYFYSPLFAFILIPFSEIPLHLAEFAWLLFSSFLLRRIWILCSSYFEQPENAKFTNLWIWLSFLSVSRFLLANITLIQVTIFILWAILESLSLMDKKKLIAGSALFALVLNIKILPITLIPYFIYRRKFKEVLLIIIFFILYLFLPSIWVGIKFNNFLLQEWWAVINPIDEERLLETGNGRYGLVAMIPVFLMDTTGEINIKRNFINLDYNVVIYIVNIVRVTFAIFTLAFLRTLPFIKENYKLKEFWEISYLLAITPLLFPHQHKYAFFLLFPMIVYLYYYTLSIKAPFSNAFLITVPLISISLFFTPIISREVLGDKLFDITEYFRVLSFLAIILVVLLYRCKPWRLRINIEN